MKRKVAWLLLTLFVLFAFLLIIPSSQAVRSPIAGSTFHWTGNVSGSWTDNTKWTFDSGSAGPGYPNAIDDVAMFGAVITNQRGISIPNGVTITVGTLNLQDDNKAYLIGNPASTGQLVFDVSSGSATVNVGGGGANNDIESQTTLNDPLIIDTPSGTLLSYFGGIGEAGGAKGITKTGAGTLRFMPVTVASHTYTGTTTVSNGLFLVNTTDTSSPFSLTGGTLSGNGTTGPITATGGTLGPGPNPPGGTVTSILNVTGNVSLNAATTFAVDLAGTTVDTQYDQLNVTGGVTLGGSTLSVTIDPAFTPALGNTFTVINNDGSADAVTGRFAGLANSGDTFTVGATTFSINYAGGDGNDVVLTVVVPAVPTPDLTITKTHVGNFTQGDTGKTYTITVTNSGNANTSGTVTVTDTVPAGLTATAIGGTGWTCTQPSGPCTRSDVLAASTSYPALTLTVNVAANASSPQTNTATVSGGGETNTANDTAPDPTTINTAAVPDLTITKTHVGNFTQGQTGATYTITVTNSGAGATVGTVSVSDTVPAGLTATAIGGTGWTCTQPSGPCTRSDVLAASTSYPAITLTVNVAANASSPQTNTATVSGGGETNTANDTATDQTTINIAGGIIMFSSPTYTVAESGGSTVITVQRTGDTSQAATVDYATSDDSGTNPVVPCSTVNNIASSRCDFTTALGTLRFAAGEGSKTFTVLISQDNFVEGLESLTLTLSNPTGGAVLAAPSTATLQITDDASEPAPNPIDDTDVFVRQHYHDFLNREADAAGLTFWTNQINSCGTDAGCREIKRINVSAAFFLSIEFQETGSLVRSFYVAALNRPNNMPRYLEFERDTQAMQQGVIVDPNNNSWQTVLAANKLAFMNDFVTRSEFVGLYPTTDAPTQYVDKLYLHAGVSPTSAERQAAIDEFGGAGTSSDTGARGRALVRVTKNSSFQQREFNPSFVQMQYFGYLRRNPDDQPDGNLNGYNFWLTKLNQFNGNFIQAEMVKAFITAGEYRHRFGQ